MKNESIDRRRFLRTSAVGAVGAVLLPATALANDSGAPNIPQHKIKKYSTSRAWPGAAKLERLPG